MILLYALRAHTWCRDLLNTGCPYALGIHGIEISPSQVSLRGNGNTVKMQHPRADEDSRPQCRCSNNETPDTLVTGIYGITDIRKMGLKRMNMQVTLREVNVFLHLPAILE